VRKRCNFQKSKYSEEKQSQERYNYDGLRMIINISKFEQIWCGFAKIQKK